MKVVFLGLSITSAWGNGHATTYRALLDGLGRRGHELLFLERDKPWYAAHRDLVTFPGCEIALYHDLAELERRHGAVIAGADAVILGSYVPEGTAVAAWIASRTRGLFAFYDIDTPVTLAKLRAGDHEYVDLEALRRFDLYLSFTGGPLLRTIEAEFGVRRARALYCAVDAQRYRPIEAEPRWSLAYLGTYSADRQPKLDALLLAPAREMPQERFAVAGPLYPDGIAWPANVDRFEHVGPPDHPAFYAAQSWALNLTRADMVAVGWSPSVRLFEAAACGVPILSDAWPGLGSLFVPGEEVLIVETTEAVLEALRAVPAERRRAIGAAARRRVLRDHTSTARAQELEHHLAQAFERRERPSSRRVLRGGG